MRIGVAHDVQSARTAGLARTMRLKRGGMPLIPIVETRYGTGRAKGARMIRRCLNKIKLVC